MSLANLYPSLSPEELKAAEENLGRYFDLAWEIAQEKSGVTPQNPEVEDDPRNV